MTELHKLSNAELAAAMTEWRPIKGPGKRGIYYVGRNLDDRSGLREYVRHPSNRPVVYRSREEALAAIRALAAASIGAKMGEE
jgi:hypothetical protein